MDIEALIIAVFGTVAMFAFLVWVINLFLSKNKRKKSFLRLMIVAEFLVIVFTIYQGIVMDGWTLLEAIAVILAMLTAWQTLSELLESRELKENP